MVLVAKGWWRIYGVGAGPVPAALHARGSHGCNVGLVALGVPRLGFDLMPLGSGIVVEETGGVFDVSRVVNDASVADDVVAEEEAPVVRVVVVAVTVGFNVSPVPVCTVTNAPGVTSAGL